MPLFALVRPELLIEAVLRLLLSLAFPHLGEGLDGDPGPRAVDAPTLAAEDTLMIAEVYHLCASLGDELWPGWTDVDLPLVLVVGDFQYAVDAPESWSGFVPVPQAASAQDDTAAATAILPALDGRISVRPRTLQPALAASFPLEGEPAAILGTPAVMGWSRTQWVLKAAHELFHVLSLRRGSMAKTASLDIGPADDASWQLDFPFPYDDVDTQALMHIEGRALYAGLSPGAEPDIIADAAATVADAHAAQQTWLAELTGDERAARYKTFQEWFEGIAKYTEHRLARAAAADDYEPLAAFVELQGADTYAELWDTVYAGQLIQIRDVGIEPAGRQVFYLLGLGKGLLLDRTSPDWRAAFFEADVWLDGLLSEPGEVRRTVATPPFKGCR